MYKKYLKENNFPESDPYVIIKCEGEKVRSSCVSNTQNPCWSDATAIFYRNNPDKPIKVQIWNKNVVVDSFMGQVRVCILNGEKFFQKVKRLLIELIH